MHTSCMPTKASVLCLKIHTQGGNNSMSKNTELENNEILDEEYVKYLEEQAEMYENEQYGRAVAIEANLHHWM